MKQLNFGMSIHSSGKVITWHQFDLRSDLLVMWMDRSRDTGIIIKHHQGDEIILILNLT